MPDIELRYLQAMAAVVDEGSFGRAAHRLGYTQSSVSQQIAALERAVGGAVFDRPGGPKAVRITALGEVVLAHGRELLGRAGALVDAVDRFRAGEGRVDIGTFQSVTNVILPPIVRRLRVEHPGCDIRLFEEETGEPVLDNLDLMFFDGPGGEGIDHLKLLDDPYVLVTRADVMPAGPVDPGRLDGLAVVAHPPICDQARVERELAEQGITPRFVFRTVGNEAVLSMVRAELGSALLPRLAVPRLTDDLVVHELTPALTPREVYLLWPAGRTHSPLVAKVITLAREFTAAR